MATAHASTESGDRNKSTRAKPGRLFFITLAVAEVYSSIREDFLLAFEGYPIVSYLVALEESRQSLEVSNHLHCYLEFEEPILLTVLRDIIVSVFDDLHLDIQSCRSKRNCLKYCSKEDVNLHTNVKESLLHINYRLYCWAKRTACFRHTDPFVVEHRNNYIFLSKYLRDFKLYGGECRCILRPLDFCWMGWALTVIMWWNDVIKGFSHKRKCLYLHGPSNTGKTSLIELLIGRNNMKYVFYPGVGKFFMQDFDGNFHKIILFEEFNYSFCVVSKLKRLLEGKKDSYAVKCCSDKLILFRGPIIFISNFEEVGDYALRNRLLFVSADTPYYREAKGPLPKTEGLSQGSPIYVISSEEESVQAVPSTSTLSS